MPVMSVPAGPIMASTLSTGAVSPSLTPMNNSVPALNDSNSMVALSVSISAKISPSETLSPIFFNQEATVPSVIVSLNRGMVTTTTPFGSDAAIGVLSVDGAATATFSSVTTADGPAFCLDALSRGAMSSPAVPMMAKSASTGAVSPSLIPICKSVPELKDSNSIVALSVSISAKISPSLILSPTFLSHFATTPSVIVSLKRGIVIIFAISIIVYGE